MIIKELQYLKLVRALLNTEDYCILSHENQFIRLRNLNIPIDIIDKAMAQVNGSY